MVDFDTIVDKASTLLKPQGKFYLVGIPERLCEMILCLNKYNFECKRIQINHTHNQVSIILIEAVLNGKSGVLLTVKN